MIKILKCIFLKHSFIEHGACPFTEQDYIICNRCGKVVVK